MKIANVSGVVEVYPDLRFITEIRYQDKPHLTMVAGLPFSSKDGDSFDYGLSNTGDQTVVFVFTVDGPGGKLFRTNPANSAIRVGR